MGIPLFKTVISLVLLSFIALQAQDGFVVWSKDGGCERELHFNKVEGGKVGEAKKFVTKGPGADIWPHISYDGVWVAWSRAQEAFKARYGACDYHSFGKFDLYIAKIDNGKNVPAEAVKVDVGYWPSWAMDENAKDPSKPKTLYYSRYSDQTIRKCVINPDGTIASKDEEHSKCLKKMSGTNAHTQGSPDGKYIAYRPGGIQVQDVAAGKNIAGAGGGGCHPSWGPRSKYLMWSKNNVCRVEDGKLTMKGKKAGIGSYFQGISNDSHYDDGKLWIIARIGGSGQNGAGSVEFREVNISGGGWEPGPTTKVGSGSACDIHVWPAGGPPSTTSLYQQQNFKNVISFNARQITGTAGLQLIIQSFEPAFSAGLYDIQGRQAAFIQNSEGAETIIPLNGVENGVYMLKLNTDKGAALKTIRIVK